MAHVPRAPLEGSSILTAGGVPILTVEDETSYEYERKQKILTTLYGLLDGGGNDEAVNKTRADLLERMSGNISEELSG